MESLIQRAPVAHIIDVKEEKKIVYKPMGLNTVTLLKSCSKGFGISPTQAMNIAEHLYTSGYISYPRTETTRYPPSFDLVGALEEQINNPNCMFIFFFFLSLKTKRGNFVYVCVYMFIKRMSLKTYDKLVF